MVLLSPGHEQSVVGGQPQWYPVVQSLTATCQYSYWQKEWNRQKHSSQPGRDQTLRNSFQSVVASATPCSMEGRFWELGWLSVEHFWCPLSQRLVRQGWAVAHRAGKNILKPVESGRFQHCLFAIHLFLCAAEGHEENFQASSAQATKKGIMCVCWEQQARGQKKRKEQYTNMFSVPPKCFCRIFSSTLIDQNNTKYLFSWRRKISRWSNTYHGLTHSAA